MSQLSDRPLRITTEPRLLHIWRLLVWLSQLRLVPLWHERFNNPLVRYYRQFFYDGLTRTGKIILVCCLLIFFMNYHNNHQFSLWLTAAGFGTLLWSAGLGYLFRPRIHIQRKTEKFAIANTPVISHLNVTNTGSRPLFNFTAREMTVPGALWIPEWERPHIAALAPGESTRVAVMFTPRKRGVLPLWGIAIQSYYPFFLSRHTQKATSHFDLYVLPQTLNVALPPLRQVVEMASANSASGRNEGRNTQSLEYVYSRQYQNGDSLKRLDHRAGGRRGEPMSKVFQGADQTHLESVYLVIDTSIRKFKAWQPQPPSTEALDRRLSLAVEVGLSAHNEGFTLEAVSLCDQWHPINNEEEFYRLIVNCAASRESQIPVSFPKMEGLAILITGHWDADLQLSVDTWENAGLLPIIFLLPETKHDRDSLPQGNNYIEVRL